MGDLLDRFSEYTHRDTTLAKVARKIGGRWFLAIDTSGGGSIPTSPTISSVATTDATWTLVASGLSGLIEWRLSELNGNDFYYAYVAAPGDDFSVGFGWVGMRTNPSAIYVRRPTDTDITVKFERWTS